MQAAAWVSSFGHLGCRVFGLLLLLALPLVTLMVVVGSDLARPVGLCLWVGSWFEVPG